jgi:16S rRNA (adenine1518-N6/adenine1519-N6)-dimethyltransferase
LNETASTVSSREPSRIFTVVAVFMSLLEETKHLLRTARIVPSRLLGQNFMINPIFLEKLATYANVYDEDVVLDIGAGFGFLSRVLSGRCRKVIAVEKDHSIAKILKEQLRGSTNVTVTEGDALHTPLSVFNKIVSIPPYQISSKLMLWLFEQRFEVALLILQKEFANRLIAKIGDDDYGWLSVLAYYHIETELLDLIPKTSFYPEPQVDSVILRSRPKSPQPFTVKSEKFFERAVRSLFTQRNRKTSNAILPLLKGELGIGKTEASGFVEKIHFLDKRVRQLAPEDFGELANALYEQRASLQ